jgi:hypothetical protein
LQNIPVRLEYGRNIRRAFIPENKEGLLLAADYSQVELRILAHFSAEPKMIKYFEDGEDIHKKTAAEIFHVHEVFVTPDMRRVAKTVNFGVIYGISAFGLARDLKISMKEAKQFIESYFLNFPKVYEYMNADVLMEDYVSLYSDVFTEEELKELDSFYKTSIGRKMLRVAPELMTRGAALGERKIQENVVELQKMIEAEAKRLEALSKAAAE